MAVVVFGGMVRLVGWRRAGRDRRLLLFISPRATALRSSLFLISPRDCAVRFGRCEFVGAWEWKTPGL
jgi:hypothetical protein